MYPETSVGKIFGSICAIFGILTIAMPLAIISTKFQDFYKHDQKKQKYLQKLEKPKVSNRKRSILIRRVSSSKSNQEMSNEVDNLNGAQNFARL